MLPRNRNNSSRSINEAEDVAKISSSNQNHEDKRNWQEGSGRNSRDLVTRNQSCQPKKQLRSLSLPPFVGAYYIGTLNAVNPRHPYFSRDSRSSSRNKENQPIRSTSQPPNRIKTKMNSDSKKLVNVHVPSATAERIEMRYRQRINNARQLVNENSKKENRNTLSLTSSKNLTYKGVPWSQSKSTSKTPESPSPTTQNSYAYPRMKWMDTSDSPASSSPSRLPIKRQRAISNRTTSKDNPQSKSAEKENTASDLQADFRSLSKIPTPNNSTRQPNKTKPSSLRKPEIECQKSPALVVSKTDSKKVVGFEQQDSLDMQEPSDVSMSTEPFTDDENRDEDMTSTEDVSLASLVTEEMQSDSHFSTPTQNNSPISFNSQSDTSTRPDVPDVSMSPEMFASNDNSVTDDTSVTDEESKTLPENDNFDLLPTSLDIKSREFENTSPISISEFPKLDSSELSPSSSKRSTSPFIIQPGDIQREEHLDSSSISESTTTNEDLESLQNLPTESKMDLEETKEIQREEDFETLAPRLVADPIEIEDFKLIHKTIMPQSPNSTESERENVEVFFPDDTKDSSTNENREVEYIIAESEIKEFFQDCVTSEKFPEEIETKSSIQQEETETTIGMNEENESKRQIVLQEAVSVAQSSDNESNSIEADSLELNCTITDNVETSEERINDLEYKDSPENEKEKQNMGLVEEPFKPIVTNECSTEPIVIECFPEQIVTTEYSSDPIVTTEYTPELTVTNEYSSEPIDNNEYSSVTEDPKEITTMECASMEQADAEEAAVMMEKDSLETSLEESQFLKQTDEAMVISAEKPTEQMSAASMEESFEPRSEEKLKTTDTDDKDTSFKSFSSFSNESQEDIDITVAFVNQKQGFKRFAKIRKKLQAIFSSSSSVDKTKYPASDLLVENTNDLVIDENIEELSVQEIFPDEISLAGLISKDSLQNDSEEKVSINDSLYNQDDQIKVPVSESTNDEKEIEINKSTEHLPETVDSSFLPTFNEFAVGTEEVEITETANDKDETSEVFPCVTENNQSLSRDVIMTVEDEISEDFACVIENKKSAEHLPETGDNSSASTFNEYNIGGEEAESTDTADYKDEIIEESVCVIEDKKSTEYLPETSDSSFAPTSNELDIGTEDVEKTDTADYKDGTSEVLELNCSITDNMETSEERKNDLEYNDTPEKEKQDMGLIEEPFKPIITTEYSPEVIVTNEYSSDPIIIIGTEEAENTDTADYKDETSEVFACVIENKESTEHLPETSDNSSVPTFNESNIGTEEAEMTDTADYKDETSEAFACVRENNQSQSREVIMTEKEKELTSVSTEEYLEDVKREEEVSEAPRIEEVIENTATTPELAKNNDEGPVSRFFNRLFSKRNSGSDIDLNSSNNQEAEVQASSRFEDGQVSENCISTDPTDNVEVVYSVQKEDTLDADPTFPNLPRTVQVYEGCEIDANSDEMKKRTTKSDCSYPDFDHENNEVDLVSETEIPDLASTENLQLPNTKSEDIMVVSNPELKITESSEVSTSNNVDTIPTGNISVDVQNNLHGFEDLTDDAKESENVPVVSKTTDSAIIEESTEELNELQSANQFNQNMSDSEIKEFFQDCVTSEKLLEKAEMEKDLTENQLNYTERSETIISGTEEINDENPGIQTLSKDSDIKESEIEGNIPENQVNNTKTSEIIVSRTEDIKDPGIQNLSKDGDSSGDQGIMKETENLPEEKLEMEADIFENQLNYPESSEIIISRTEEIKDEDPGIQTLSKDGDSSGDQGIRIETEILTEDVDDVMSSEGKIPEVRSPEEESKTDLKTETNETENKKPAILKKPFFGFVPKLKRAFNFKTDKKEESSNSQESKSNADPDVEQIESTQEPLTTIEKVEYSSEITIIEEEEEEKEEEEEEEILQPNLAANDVVEETLLETPLEVTNTEVVHSGSESTEAVLSESENVGSDTLELAKVETDKLVVTDNQVDSPTIETVCETEEQKEQNPEEIPDVEEKDQEEDIFYFEPELPADNLKSEEVSSPEITSEEHSEKSIVKEEIGAEKSRSWYEKMKDFFGSKKAKEGSFDEVLNGDSTFRRSESYHTKQLDSDVAPGSYGSTHWSDIVDENVVATLPSDMLDEESTPPKEWRIGENDPSAAEPINILVDPDADNIPTNNHNEDDSNLVAQNPIDEGSVCDQKSNINDPEDQSIQTIISSDNPDSKVTPEKPYSTGVTDQTPDIDLAAEIVPSIETREDVNLNCPLSATETEVEDGDRPWKKIAEAVVEEESEMSIPLDIKKLKMMSLNNCPPDEVHQGVDSLNGDKNIEQELQIDQVDPESECTEILPIHKIEEPENQTIPESIPAEETDSVMEESYENALLQVFAYLDHKTLCVTSQVCKQWRSISYCPSLWQHVVFSHGRMTSKFLERFSERCSQLKTLILENIQGRPKRRGESERLYQEEMRASLEPGLESILIKAEGNLQKLSFINCGPVITERCLWLVSCYARVLQNLTYRSATDPPSAQVLWALASGCRDITHLNLSPDNPRSPQQERFNNKCAHLIAKNYPRLEFISVGGSGIDDVGLLIIAEKCQQLERLELYNFVHKIVESSVENMSTSGLQKLQELYFIHTAVDAKIIPVFARNCPNLKKIKIQVEIQDYFGDILQPKDRRKYKVISLKLKSLKSQSKLDQILELDIKDCK